MLYKRTVLLALFAEHDFIIAVLSYLGSFRFISSFEKNAVIRIFGIRVGYKFSTVSSQLPKMER